MYAIIETGGKQYRVSSGEVLSLEKLNGNVGDKITFDKVLLIGGQTDGAALVGTPYVPNAQLQVEIVEHSKGEKILTIKYRRRKGYRRTMGHRQQLTRILVTEINNGAGNKVQFDASQRAAVLTKASVPFSERKKKDVATRAAKLEAKTTGKSAPKAEKATKVAKTAAKTTATKKTTKKA